MTLPWLNARKLDDVVVATYLVVYGSPQSKSEVGRRILLHFGDYIAVAELSDPDHAYVAVMFQNVSQADEMLSWLRRQQNVKSARLNLVERIDIQLDHTTNGGSLQQHRIRHAAHLR